MESLVTTAAELQDFCNGQGWSFCFIGGFAVQHWGEPRLTRDLDLSLLTGFGVEEDFVTPLLERFEARRPDAAEFALMNRVLLLKSPAGIGLDVALAALPFEGHVIERAVDVEYAKDTMIRICSPEDLIVHKAFANRIIDWHDIEGILVRQQGKLNNTQIINELTPLIELKEEPEILNHLGKLLAKYS